MSVNYLQQCCYPECGTELPTIRDWFCDAHAAYRPLERALYHTSVSTCAPEERALTAVYVIGSDRVDAVKIGIAVDIQQRMASLQTGFPFPLKLYSALYTARRMALSLEAAVHAQLKELDVHLNGEWFDVTPEDAARVVAKVASAEGIPVLSPWVYSDMCGWPEMAVQHETFSLNATLRQLLRDNVVAPFGMGLDKSA